LRGGNNQAPGREQTSLQDVRYIYCLSIYFLFALIFINEWNQLQEDVFVTFSYATLISLLISSIFMIKGFHFL
jgi:hypothetical protein